MKKKPVYVAQCKKALASVAVYLSSDKKTFDVYENDGNGDGSFLDNFGTELIACTWANLHCQELDKSK